ncbi:MAG: hypothetical protein AAB857_02115 [Patescibacteria group bacterium]
MIKSNLLDSNAQGMTKKTKRILFYSAVVIFVLLSYVVILYAQGYKYSFSEAKFFRTGSIFVKANEDAKVYVDDKFLNSTSFFGNSYTISGLLPGQYTVRLQKDDYGFWQKKVSVEEGLVSDYSKILLLPKSGEAKESLKIEIKDLFYPTPKPTPTPSVKPTPKPLPSKTPTFSPVSVSTDPFYLKNGVLFKNMENGETERLAYLVIGFTLSPDNKKIAWWNANELWVMWLSNTDYQPFHKAGDKDLITRFSIKIKNAAWFRDSDHVVVDSGGYKVIEIDKRGGLNIIEI